MLLRKRKPYQIVLDITHRCQLHCKYCSRWEINHADVIEKELTTEEWKNAILKLKNWLGEQLTIVFSGGEPFLRTDLFEIIRYAKTLGIKVVCVTNAFNIQNLYEKILDSDLDTICISLNSIKDSSIHDLSRGTVGSYNKVLHSISELKKLKQKSNKKLNIKIATIIFPENLDELIPLVDFAKENKLDGISFQLLEDNITFWRESNEHDEKLLDYKMPIELYNNYMHILEKEYIFDELIKKKEKGTFINNPQKQLEAMKSFLKNPSDFIKNNSCRVCNSNFSVDPYGNVRTCFNMKSIGNIKENLPEHLWTNEKAQQCRAFAKKCKMGCRLLNCNFYDNSIHANILRIRFIVNEYLFILKNFFSHHSKS